MKTTAMVLCLSLTAALPASVRGGERVVGVEEPAAQRATQFHHDFSPGQTLQDKVHIAGISYPLPDGVWTVCGTNTPGEDEQTVKAASGGQSVLEGELYLYQQSGQQLSHFLVLTIPLGAAAASTTPAALPAICHPQSSSPARLWQASYSLLPGALDCASVSYGNAINWKGVEENFLKSSLKKRGVGYGGNHLTAKLYISDGGNYYSLVYAEYLDTLDYLDLARFKTTQAMSIRQFTEQTLRLRDLLKAGIPQRP